jgi:PPOX class probable F420-dependent enzyme
MRRNLMPEELAELLAGRALAILATHRKDGSTMLSPVWHEWADGGFSIVIGADDPKSLHLQRDARLTVLVAQHEPPYASIELRGSAVLSRSSGVHAIARRIAIRYLGEEGGNAYADQLAAESLELVRLVPGTVRAWDFRDDFG